MTCPSQTPAPPPRQKFWSNNAPGLPGDENAWNLLRGKEVLLALFQQETCIEIMIYSETCQENFQMVPIEAKTCQSYMAKHMIVLYLDSSKSERCAVKFSKMFFSKYKGKNLMMQIKLF